MDQGIEQDHDIRSALDRLASVSGDSDAFWTRLERAQQTYRVATSSPDSLGQDPDLNALGEDVVSAFLAQAKSLLDDRRSYDFALASRTVPWVKQLGKNVTALDRVPGSHERAARMLRAHTVHPDSAMLELVMAGNYAADGFDVAFVDEAKGGARTPDLCLFAPRFQQAIPVELKRLRRGRYEIEEQHRHKLLFRKAAELIDERALSVHIDVTYTRELANVPESYLADRLAQARSSPIVTLRSYPWRDEFGFGEVKPANLNAVRQDIRDSSLYFDTKLARLLSGRVVRERGYHMTAGAEPDARDPRYIEEIRYGSVITWQCVAPRAIERKARYVKAKLVEADRQLTGHGPGIAHLAVDAELQCQSSDLRRARNFETIKAFRSASTLMAIYVHYLVPRISEAHSWMNDETVDRFGPGFEPVPDLMIFPGSATIENDLPAWRQDVPLPKQ